MSKPDNHVSNFPVEWWNERRSRDYFVDADGFVRLYPDSPTAKNLEINLIQVARDMAARYVAPTKN